MQRDIDMNNKKKITNLANPVNDQDAASLTSVKQYIGMGFDRNINMV